MSTLASCPSPAASPRHPFRSPPPPPPRTLRHRSSSSSSSSSSRRSSADRPNRPGFRHLSPTQTSNPPLPPSRPVARPISQDLGASPLLQPRGRYVQYAHASTQYSPDGLPPTAGRKVARSAAAQPPGSSDSGGKKRKEGALELDESMTSETAASATTSAAPSAARSLRPTSTPTAVGAASASKTAGPSEPRFPPRPDVEPASPAASLHAEPQEARSTHGHSSAPKRSRPEPGNAKVMPLRYWTCNPKDLGVLISNMLMELIRLNDRIPLRDGRLTRFHSRAPPGISVTDYLQRLIHHATLSPPILLSMVWYIDRLCQLYPAFTINSLTVHRFLITAATVAAKGLSDSFWTNPTYARIGGIPVSELATLELEFLQKVQWKIVPKPEVLEDYYQSLVERTEGFDLEQSPSTGSEGGNLSVNESQAWNDDDDMVDKPA